jgi:hypothetical protein
VGIGITYDSILVVAGFAANGQGSWTITFTIPTSTNGPHNIAATRTTPPGGIVGPVTFTVTTPTISLSPTSSPPGTSVPGTGTDVPPSIVNINVGQETTLDIFLNEAHGAQVVAWETHFMVYGGASIELVAINSEPVREQGEGFALSKPDKAGVPLQRLATDGSNEATADYFTAQNQYNPSTGKLDYSHTLLRFSSDDPEQRVIPFSGSPHLILGRITIKGLVGGTARIEAASGCPVPSFKVIMMDRSQTGKLDYLTPICPASTPLATINVSAAPRLKGRVAPQIPRPEPPNADRWSTALEVTLWSPGAVPPWKGGTATPASTFHVPSDANGVFEVNNFPMGTFDIRVKECGASNTQVVDCWPLRELRPNVISRTLTSLCPNVIIVASGASSGGTCGLADGAVLFSDQRDGDVNNEDLVDGEDFSLLRPCFGQLLPRTNDNPNFNCEKANFNRDTVVDGEDFSRLRQNFAKLGD